MPIIFNHESQQFHLYNNSLSYIIEILPSNYLHHVYFGKKVTHVGETKSLLDVSLRDMAPISEDDLERTSLDLLRQEVSIFGRGDLRETQLAFEFLDGSTTTNFKYHHHEIFSGKKILNGLPSIQPNSESDGTSLWIYLMDDIQQQVIILKYFIFETRALLTRSLEIVNDNNEIVRVKKALSITLDFPDYQYKQLILSGAWARERHPEVHSLHRGVQSIYSLRGHSSYQYNPFLGLIRPQADETQGEVFGFNFVYSGNFIGQAEVDNYDATRVMFGIHPEGFSWELNPKESLELPEVAIVYSSNGLNEMSQTYHDVYNNYLVRKPWRNKRRPVLINSWEAMYFDFDQDKIIKLLDCAKKIGIELFVLDDGWFGNRNDATSSLGDWYPDLKKLPQGISGLSKQIKEKGLKFGLWFEPEMISKKSQLYQKHPDWVLGDVNKIQSIGRNQLCLDFSKQDVIDYLYEKMSKIIEEGGLDYIKWDLNRSMTEVFSQGESRELQGEIYHKCVLGMYQLHQLLLDRFPNLLIEACASGGARFDPGMLYYAPQIWTSDNTDAFDRLKIQYGTSMVYPLSTMGTHVSASPNHQTHREISLKTRDNLALFGTYGFELDLTKMTDEELAIIKENVKSQKKGAALIQQGKLYRLRSPFSSNYSSWIIVDGKKTEAIVFIYRQLAATNIQMPILYLEGLDKEKRYRLMEDGKDLFNRSYYGDELMSIGIPLSKVISSEKDYQSCILQLKSV